MFGHLYEWDGGARDGDTPVLVRGIPPPIPVWVTTDSGYTIAGVYRPVLEGDRHLMKWERVDAEEETE